VEQWESAEWSVQGCAAWLLMHMPAHVLF